ncbi:hypothetical protein SGPA1_41177 [Streptomyces misionensis JCM 4497]
MERGARPAVPPGGGGRHHALPGPPDRGRTADLHHAQQGPGHRRRLWADAHRGRQGAPRRTVPQGPAPGRLRSRHVPHHPHRPPLRHPAHGQTPGLRRPALPGPGVPLPVPRPPRHPGGERRPADRHGATGREVPEVLPRDPRGRLRGVRREHRHHLGRTAPAAVHAGDLGTAAHPHAAARGARAVPQEVDGDQGRPGPDGAGELRRGPVTPDRGAHGGRPDHEVQGGLLRPGRLPHPQQPAVPHRLRRGGLPVRLRDLTALPCGPQPQLPAPERIPHPRGDRRPQGAGRHDRAVRPDRPPDLRAHRRTGVRRAAHGHPRHPSRRPRRHQRQGRREPAAAARRPDQALSRPSRRPAPEPAAVLGRRHARPPQGLLLLHPVRAVGGSGGGQRLPPVLGRGRHHRRR